MPSRRPWALGFLTAVVLAVAGTGTAAAADAAPPYPAQAPGDEREIVPSDPKLVLPTDTEVAPPAPDFVAPDTPSSHGYGTWRAEGPNVAYGSMSWGYTRQGPAAGVRVSYVSRQTGWRFTTTADAAGRYRLAVPDGTYDVLVADTRLEHGTWVDPRGGSPYVVTGIETWNGGLATGLMGGVVARPRDSCRIDAEVVVEGAPGGLHPDDPAVAPCPYVRSMAATPETMAQVMAATLALGEWALTGTDPLPPARAGSALAWKPGTLGAGASPVAPVVLPRAGRLPATVRVRRGAASFLARTRCASGAVCAGSVRVVARDRRTLLARGVLRAGGRDVRLRTTVAGRRAVRRAGPAGVRGRAVWVDGRGRVRARSAIRIAVSP